MSKLTWKLLCILVQNAAIGNDRMADDAEGLHCGQELPAPCGERSIVSTTQCDFVHSSRVGNAPCEPDCLKRPVAWQRGDFSLSSANWPNIWLFFTSWAECPVSVALADKTESWRPGGAGPLLMDSPAVKLWFYILLPTPGAVFLPPIVVSHRLRAWSCQALDFSIENQLSGPSFIVTWKYNCQSLYVFLLLYILQFNKDQIFTGYQAVILTHRGWAVFMDEWGQPWVSPRGSGGISNGVDMRACLSHSAQTILAKQHFEFSTDIPLLKEKRSEKHFDVNSSKCENIVKTRQNAFLHL